VVKKLRVQEVAVKELGLKKVVDGDLKKKNMKIKRENALVQST